MATPKEEKTGVFIPMTTIIGLVVIVAGSFISQLIISAQRGKDLESLQTKVIRLEQWQESHKQEHFEHAIQENNNFNEIKNSLQMLQLIKNKDRK
jgi:hypothetical protein